MRHKKLKKAIELVSAIFLIFVGIFIFLSFFFPGLIVVLFQEVFVRVHIPWTFLTVLGVLGTVTFFAWMTFLYTPSPPIAEPFTGGFWRWAAGAVALFFAALFSFFAISLLREPFFVVLPWLPIGLMVFLKWRRDRTHAMHARALELEIEDQLIELWNQLYSGIITREEFEQKRRRALRGLRKLKLQLGRGDISEEEYEQKKKELLEKSKNPTKPQKV